MTSRSSPASITAISSLIWRTGKPHADENFTWAGFRFGQFSYGEDVVGVAGAFKNKCFHKCSPSVVVSLR
jgi:hypothetical protein